MFGLFKKKAPSPLDEIVKAMYGDSPPTSKPDLDEAIRLAHEDLLQSLIDEGEVRDLAKGLDDGPMPYSTHSLALSVAMNFFRQPELAGVLQDAQLFARMTALGWAKEGRIPMMLLAVFEKALYTRYK